MLKILAKFIFDEALKNYGPKGCPGSAELKTRKKTAPDQSSNSSQGLNPSTFSPE